MSNTTNRTIEKNVVEFLKAANDLNFWGKRLREAKLTVADVILSKFDISQSTLESSVLADWLEANRPVKQKKAQSHATKVAEQLEPTFAGSLKGRELEELEDGLYIITAAQNNTVVHPVFNTLVSMAKSLNAQLGIMPIKYTTTLQGLERKSPSWAGEIRPYLLEDRDQWLGGEGYVLLANSAQILPTAKQPINAAEQLNTGESLTVVASPKRQLKTLARQKNGCHRWAYTTTVCTAMHYTDTRAGAEAENEHCFGGILIEVQDGLVSHKRLVADRDGVIITDDGTVYFPDGRIEKYVDVYAGKQPLVVLGDLHCEKLCLDAWGRTLAWLARVQPEKIVVHDALDFMSRNHHNREDWTFLYQQQNRAVVDDLTDVINRLNELAGYGDVYVVESNHDLALDSWIRDTKFDIRKDPINARTYHALKLAYIDAMDENSFNDLAKMDLAFRGLADRLPELSANIEFGKIDDEKLFYGWDYTMHGHVGTGGARGSKQSFKKMRIKSVTGHTHSPLEDHNTVIVGVTGSLEMGYNKGGTTWDRANAIIYPNGTCSLVPLYKIGEQQS